MAEPWFLIFFNIENNEKLLFIILTAAGLSLSVTSCWKENLPEAGAARHQVTDLKAVPGDEEAQLSWSMPEGWNPTEYLITYTDGDKISLRTSEKSYSITGLTNGETYTFEVQAVYGDLISGAVSAAAKPTTSRFAVSDLVAEGSANMVILTWTKPSTNVTSYTLTYSSDNTAAQEISIEADKESYTVDELENDVIYTFSLVANYAKGPSEPAVAKAMPALAVPYFLDRTTAAVNQPVKFTFNTEGYPSATNIRWTFPDGKILTGTEVSYGIPSSGTQHVTLTVHLGDKDKSWNIELQIRDYVVNYIDWECVGANYNGFKGSCPVFSPDGKTVYNITFNKTTCLYAFNVETGELAWVYKPSTAAGSYNMLTVNPVTGDIYFGTTTAGQFYCVNAKGDLKWKFDGAGSMKSAAPAVNKDGSVVFIGDGAGNIFALDAASGAKKWQAALGSATAGLLVNGNELVAGATNGTVTFYNTADGTAISSLKFACMTDITGFAVGNDKRTVYLPAKTAMCSFDLETRSILVESLSVADNNLYEPVVAPNGNVYVAGKDNCVYCLDKDLTRVVWKYQHTDAAGKVVNAFNYSHPCVDTENHLYITSGQAGNVSYIFNADGTVKESWTYGTSNQQKQMGGNNYLNGVFYSAFVGNTGDNGAFYGKYVGGERANTWSTHGGDICGSCCLK